MFQAYKLGDLVSVAQSGRPRLGFVTEVIFAGPDASALHFPGHPRGSSANFRITITYLQPYASRYDGRLVTHIIRIPPHRGVTLVSRPEAHNTGETSCLE